MGSMAPALLPRTRRRGRSLIVGKVAAATSDLDVFFIAASKNLDVFVERCGDHCAAVTGRSDQVQRLGHLTLNGLVPHGAIPRRFYLPLSSGAATASRGLKNGFDQGVGMQTVALGVDAFCTNTHSDNST